MPVHGVQERSNGAPEKLTHARMHDISNAHLRGYAPSMYKG